MAPIDDVGVWSRKKFDYEPVEDAAESRQVCVFMHYTQRDSPDYLLDVCDVCRVHVTSCTFGHPIRVVHGRAILLSLGEVRYDVGAWLEEWSRSEFDSGSFVGVAPSFLGYTANLAVQIDATLGDLWNLLLYFEGYRGIAQNSSHEADQWLKTTLAGVNIQGIQTDSHKIIIGFEEILVGGAMNFPDVDVLLERARTCSDNLKLLMLLTNGSAGGNTVWVGTENVDSMFGVVDSAFSTLRKVRDLLPSIRNEAI